MAPVTVSITDDGGPINPQDDRGVTVSPTSLTVREGDTTGSTYTVVLDSAPTSDVIVTVGGHSGTDLTVNPSGLTFTTQNYDDEQDVRVTVVHDVDAEDDPPVTLTHTANGGGYNGVTGDDVTVTIDDDDTASNRFTLAVNPTGVSEGVGSSGMAVTVTATLNNAPRTSNTDVTVSVGPGTASANDFEPVDDFTLRIDAGQMIGTADFQLKPVDDEVDESDETVRVSGSASGPTMNSPAPSVTILDNDTRGILVSPAKISVREGDTGEYDVSLATQPTRNVRIRISGHSGSDLLVDDTTLDFTGQNWNMVQTVTVTAGTDMDNVQDPNIVLTHAASGSDYGGETATVTVTILDTDQASTAVVLSVNPDRVSEKRGSGGETVTVTGQLNGATRTSATVVTVSVAADTAQPEDFTAVTNFPLTIPANQASGTASFRLRPENDTLDEEDETLEVSGTSDLTVTSAPLTIVDDDGAPSGIELSVRPRTLREDVGEMDIKVTAKLVGGGTLLQDTVVDLLPVVAGTASLDSDYTATDPGTITITQGTLSGTATFTLTVVDDTEVESRETVQVTGTTSSALTVHSALIFIEDNDGSGGRSGGSGGRSGGGGGGGGGGGTTGTPPLAGLDLPPPELRLQDVRAPEDAGRMVFTVELSGISEAPVSVRWETANGTAKSGSDYTAASGTLTIPAGEWSGTIRVGLPDDRLHEPDETFALRLSRPEGATVSDDEAIGTILDDDPEPELRMGDASGAEKASEIVFAARLSAASGLPVRVGWRTMDGNASAGADYSAAEGVLTIPAGVRTANVSVPLLDDRLDEADETFTIELSQPVGATLDDTQAVGTILDDDAEPALLIGDATASEGDGRLGFFVWLASDSGRTVTVDYATRAGTAIAGVDYRTASGTLTIPPGSTGETIWVTIVDDRLHENRETLELVLMDPEFAVPGDLVATGTIKDDDAEPGLSIADVSASERAGGMVFVATMGAVAGRTLSWEFETRDGSAVADEDYRRSAGTLVFKAGETRRTISVTILDDTMDEVEEDFTITVRNPRDSGLAVPEPTGLILDDDDNAVVADAWASRFGRTVATQVVNAVAGRFAGMGGPGSHFLFGLDPYSTFGLAGARGNHRWENQWRDTSTGGSESVRLGLDPGRILSGTSFVYQTEEDEPSDGGLDGRWTAWGRGSFLQFDGLEPGVGVSGEVFNITTGFDYETGPLMVGLALAGSVGTGDYHVARTGIQSERMGEIWSLLGSAHPYVQVALAEWLRVWGLGGIGSGTLRISGSEQDADLGMRMWAFGGRSDLRVPGLGGLRFALKSDMFWVEMDAGATDTRRGSTAEARRLRLMLESSFRVISFWGGEFSPLLEAGVRDDAGDAETGRGLEVASGFRFQNRDRGFFVEATARTLVSHEDETYREWGIGGTLRLDPGPDYLGLAIQINSSQGAAASSVQRMWSDPGAVTYFPGMAQGRHEAEVGYGFRALRGGAMVIPFSGFAYSPSGANSFRVGSRVRLGSRWMLSLQADRNRYGFRDPWYGLVLRGHLLPERWMRPAPAGESR